MRRRIVGNIDLILLAGLCVASYSVMHWRPADLDAASVSSLVGAMIGGAALLLGNWINRFNDRQQAETDLDRRHEKLKVLIAAELIDVATGIMIGMPELQSRLVVIKSGGRVHPFDPNAFSPRTMPLTDTLGVELLSLDKAVLDPLMMLRSSLAISREISKSTVENIERDPVGFRAKTLVDALACNLKLIVQILKLISPDRVIELPYLPPEKAVSILTRTANSLAW